MRRDRLAEFLDFREQRQIGLAEQRAARDRVGPDVKTHRAVFRRTIRLFDGFLYILHRQDRRRPQPFRILRAVIDRPVVVGAATRGEELGVAELAPERSKRSMAFFTAFRKPGAAIGYLPFSRVNGSPSTKKVRRPDSAAMPILGACDLYFSSMNFSNTHSGSIRCASTSTILNPSFICLSSQYAV